MPVARAKEAPLTPQLEAALQALTSRAASDVTVEEWKALGNECFSHGSFLTAIRCYTKAMEQDGGDTAVLRSNRSAAYVKSSMHAGPALALKDAERAVELAPTWYKAHLRVADAQFARHKLPEAQQAYEHALALEPGCTAATTALHTLRREIFLHELEQKERQERLHGTTDTGEAQAKTEFHNAPWDEKTTAGDDLARRHGAPTTEDTARLIDSWRRDTCVRDDRTAMTPRAVSVQEADRQGGQAYRERLLRNFRHKVESDETFSATLRENLAREQLAGADVDFRQGNKHRAYYAHATDGIGLGITAEAFKDHIAYDKT